MTDIQAIDRAGRTTPGSLVTRLRLALLKRTLARIAAGRLEVVTPEGVELVFAGPATGPRATVRLNHWRAFSRILRGGDIGLAAAYMDGDWSTADLGSVLAFGLANEAAMRRQLDGSLVSRALNRLRHLANANSKAGSRENIAFHYDLGNAFYGEWLDRTMTYSAALYQGDQDRLEDAQLAKYRAICHQLGLKPGDRVLEIGCGWGGFAEVATSEFGARVHGITLSREQLAFARDRIKNKTLDHLASFSLTDYRDVEGRFDHVVSIEMFEAVGREYWPSFQDCLRRCLKPGGKAFLQIITIADQRFERYAASADFIQRYIFPGGMLPSPSRLRTLFNTGDLRIDQETYAGDDYARTLQEWRTAFLDAWPRITGLGFDARFRRLWEYYLHYCEVGFRHGTIDLARLVVTREE